MMKMHFQSMLLTALVATVPASAQDSSKQQDSQKQRNQDRQQQQDRRQQDRSPKNDSNEENSSRVKAVPQGYVTVGADYDNDGRFDAIETIYLYDLQEAQKKSRQRANASEKSQTAKSGQDSKMQDSKMSDPSGQEQAERYSARRRSMDSDSQRDRRMKSDQRKQQNRIAQNDRGRSGDDRVMQLTGKISETKTGKLAGKKDPFLMAHIDTDDGSRACVVLGPEKKLSDWNLRQGDELKVRGVKARLNDRAVVMADKVMHDGKTVSVDLPPAQRLKRAKGEVTDLRTVRFRNFGQPFVVAEIETPNQKRQVVNLGPKDNLNQLNLSVGDEIRILAREGRVNGESAMIAQQINAEDRTVTVPRPEDTKRFKSRNRSNDRG